MRNIAITIALWVLVPSVPIVIYIVNRKKAKLSGHGRK